MIEDDSSLKVLCLAYFSGKYLLVIFTKAIKIIQKIILRFIVNIRTMSTLKAGLSPEIKRSAMQEMVKVEGLKKRKLKRYKPKQVDSTSPLGVLSYEISALINEYGLSRDHTINDVGAILNDTYDGPIHRKYHREVDNVNVLKLTSNGDGLALVDNPMEENKKQIVLIPFALPGDLVKIKIFKTHPSYVESDLLDIIKPSEMRDHSLIKCKYFGKCSGCQFQFITYQNQLNFKRNIILNAYKYFAPKLMKNKLIPEIGSTVGSPLELEYRTKLTPHFDMPKKLNQLKERPSLGFGRKGKPMWRINEYGGDSMVLDIEECIIGTKIINQGMNNERKKFETNFKTYKRGATILLRENTKIADGTKPITDQVDDGSKNPNTGLISYLTMQDKEKTLIKTCVTNTKQIVTEYIDGYNFQFSAGEFFQNNNSILPIVTRYVRENLRIPNLKEGQPHYLVDAYCGSGLFSITASIGVDKVIGVEISADSIAFAKKNAEKNGIKNCNFIVGKAEKIFASIDTPNDRTSVILDPPRKGCDNIFLEQLADYHPIRIVYISCNVHSQARDVEYFINETKDGKLYRIESLQGFDFFPQTHHVESICVLTRD